MKDELALSTEEIPLERLGTIFVKSGFFTDSRDASQAIVKILAGRELGFSPIASMTGVYIVKGKVSLSANLMASRIKSSGKYNYKVAELTDKGCTVNFYEGGELIGTSTFTIEDAKLAGIATGDNWRKFPRNMLFARALSNGAKWYCPDAFNGAPIYTPEELGAKVNEEGEVIEPTDTVEVYKGNDGITTLVIPEPETIYPERMTTEQANEDLGFETPKVAKREWVAPEVDYDLAKTQKNSMGIAYGDIVNPETLQGMEATILRKLDKSTDPDEQDALLFKLGALRSVMVYNAEHTVSID